MRMDKERIIYHLVVSFCVYFWHTINNSRCFRVTVINGYLEFSYDLGTGSAVIRNDKIRINDGQRHSVILKRDGTSGSIEIDHTYIVNGEAPGFTATMNCAGNIYLGGTPDLDLMTAKRFTQGFNGCIHGFEIQNSKTLDLGTKAISGVNIKPCSR